MNENGQRFAELCANNKFVIGGSIFAHKRLHKETWVSPDHITENQIYHFCINKKCKRSLQDVCVKRGADVASDHHLLVGKIRMRLKKELTIKNPRVKYNVNFLEDNTTKDQFNITLSSKFQILEELDNNGNNKITEHRAIFQKGTAKLIDQQTDKISQQPENIEDQWSQIKDMINNTCEETLGRKSYTQKECETPETLRKVQERKQKKSTINCSRTRKEKEAAQAEYNKAHKEVRQSVRKDRRTYIENLAAQVEEAANMRDMKDLYDTTKTRAGNFRQTSQQIKDKNGKVLTTTEEQLARWAEHIKELLKRTPPDVTPEIKRADEELQINLNLPSKTEIKQAIKKWKTAKASGPENIPPEALKANPDLTANILHKIYSDIWKNEVMTQDWNIGHLIKLPM